MRYLIFIFLMLPAIAFAQRQRDYEHAIGKFVKFYNNKQSDSIDMMWPEKYRVQLAHMYGPESMSSLHEKYGEIKSYKYIGKDTSDPDKVAVFKIMLSKAGMKALSLTLEDGKYLGTFRFWTSSPEIERMLKGSK